MRRGLTLAEIILAIGFASTICVLVAVVMARGLRWLGQTRERTVAQSAARDFLERVKQKGAAGLPADGVYDGRIPTPRHINPDFPPAPYEFVEEDGKRYYLVVKLSTVRPALRAVQVDVTWSGRSFLTLETYVH